MLTAQDCKKIYVNYYCNMKKICWGQLFIISFFLSLAFASWDIENKWHPLYYIFLLYTQSMTTYQKIYIYEKFLVRWIWISMVLFFLFFTFISGENGITFLFHTFFLFLLLCKNKILSVLLYFYIFRKRKYNFHSTAWISTLVCCVIKQLWFV